MCIRDSSFTRRGVDLEDLVDEFHREGFTTNDAPGVLDLHISSADRLLVIARDGAR